jgi:hypothetical protein
MESLFYSGVRPRKNLRHRHENCTLPAPIRPHQQMDIRFFRIPPGLELNIQVVETSNAFQNQPFDYHKYLPVLGQQIGNGQPDRRD